MAGTADQCTCGIIMPISHSDEDHTEAHWSAVLNFISEAIERAGMMPQPVWHNGDFDVIQAKILRNLFENEIIVCDVSTKNPNVMLELGMRLTTKRPTIIIAETGTKLPFDTSVIHTEFYNPALKYAEIAAFVSKLSDLLAGALASSRAGNYHAYLELFEFETVKPSSVTISGEEAIADRLDEMNSRLNRLDGRVATIASAEPSRRPGTDAFVQDLASYGAPDANGITWDSPTYFNPDIKVDANVFHEKFGEGVVTGVERNQVQVAFTKAGSRRVLASFLKLL